MKRFTILLLLFLSQYALLFARPITSSIHQDIDWPAFMAQHDLVWEELPLQWNEGAFTGNAHLGMMVFATLKDNRIDFHIGRQDVTDHRKVPDRKTSSGVPGANVMYDFCRLDIGRIALRPSGKIISGTIRQDLWNSEIRATILTTLGEIRFRAFTPYDKMIQIVEVTSSEKNGSVPTPYQWSFLPGNPSSPRALVFPETQEAKAYITNPPPVIRKEKKATICTQTLLAGGDFATAWTEQKGKQVNQSTLYITTANEVPAVGVSAKVALKNILDAEKMQVREIEKPHRDWWHNFYRQSFLSVPDGRLESFYWIQLYKIATCSRPDGPAVDLFGPYYRTSQWPGIWWNLNIQLTYWPVYESNHLELGENLITLIDEQFDVLLKNKGTRLGDFAWAMHNYWLQYAYAGDWKSIQTKWVPKAIQIADSYEKMMFRDSTGKIQLIPMESPEYKGFVKYPNTNYNLGLVRWLLNTLIANCERAGINQPEVIKWKKTLADLIPYPVDQNGLMIGSNQSLDMSHRHFSHLLSLYPLFQLKPDNRSDSLLVDRSVDHWHKIDGGKALAGYSYTGAASLYAALGRGNDALAILENFLLGNIGISQLCTNTFYVEGGGKNPVIETPLSGAASVMELLLQSWGNILRIFPAVPDQWKEASFYQLRALGGFLVSGARGNGKTMWVHVKSLAGEPCVIKIKDWNTAYSSQYPGKPIAASGNHEFKIVLKAGEEILLSSSSTPAKPLLLPVSHQGSEINLYGVKKGMQLPKNQDWPEPEVSAIILSR